MTEQEKLMYEILGQITTSDIPIVFKGGLITKLILNESGLNSVQRTTKDIDANWIGQPPSMDYLVDSLNNSFGDLQKSYKAIASRQYGIRQSAGISIIDKNTGRKFITMDIDIKPLIDSKNYYFHNKKAEIEHAYDKLKGIEGKPDFNSVYNYLCKFVVPFEQEIIPNKLWNSKTLSWNDVCRTRFSLSRKQINQNAKIISHTQENQSQHNKNKNKGR